MSSAGTECAATDFVIAVDGPSGTGKSTVSRELARRLSAIYVDTGAMYRMVTLAVLRAGIDPHDGAAVAELLPQLTFDSPVDPGQQRHFLAGEDVTAEIRGTDVTTAVTPVSANPAVREWLLQRQQNLAAAGRVVMEGRDIGTVIVPGAPLKIFLTADESERARRRHRQAGRAGEVADLAHLQAAIARRDAADSGRQTAPLRAADDAVHLDTSHLNIDQVVLHMLELAVERGLVGSANR